MIDSDIANLFNYSTKDLNRNVKNNINRFPEYYCFRLIEGEYRNLRCKNFTSNSNRNYGGRRYLPYVFNDYGIVMLAGILKSEVAVSMSIKIVNEFIIMKKYINNDLIEQKFYKEMLLRHDKDIKLLQESFDKITLDIISKLNVKVILIVKEKGRLNKIDIKKYNKQYNNLKII